MLNQEYREIINIATLASLIGEWWALRVQFQNPCLNYHPPECSDEVILWLPSISPKFLWVVCKTMVRLKDFKVREKKSVLCFVLQNYVRYLKPFQKHPWYCWSSHPGWWCHPGDVWHNLEIFLVHLVGEARGAGEHPTTHRISAWDKELVQNVHRAEFHKHCPRTIHPLYSWFHHRLPTGVTPGPVPFAALSERASINPRNIWNEIPAAELLWKAVTCWWAEAYATKIDQLHKLSRALKEFILLVWTSVAVLSKSKTQMVPRVAKLGKKI